MLLKWKSEISLNICVWTDSDFWSDYDISLLLEFIKSFKILIPSFAYFQSHIRKTGIRNTKKEKKNSIQFRRNNVEVIRC